MVLVLATIGSLLAAGRFANVAERQGNSARAERSARLEADLARKAAEKDRKGADLAREAAEKDRTAAEKARASAQAETYRAMLSEVKALRAGHQLGWREEALENLARLAVMPTPRRDLVELRNEAVASLGEFDVVQVMRLEGLQGTVDQLDFSPDSRTLVTATRSGSVDLWDVARRQHSWRVEGPDGKSRPSEDRNLLRPVPARWWPGADLLGPSGRVPRFLGLAIGPAPDRRRDGPGGPAGGRSPGSLARGRVV